MFFSSVRADDDLKRYPAAIQKAIEYAKNTDFSALEVDRLELAILHVGAALVELEALTLQIRLSAHDEVGLSAAARWLRIRSRSAQSFPSEIRIPF